MKDSITYCLECIGEDRRQFKKLKMDVSFSVGLDGGERGSRVNYYFQCLAVLAGFQAKRIHYLD